MILFSILFGLLILAILGIIVYNWWRDEQEKYGTREFLSGPGLRAVPAVASAPRTALHPSIDPYLAELRAYLLTPPLPTGPGDMAERVYTHLNQWVNEHLTYDAEHTVDVDDELLTGPVQRFQNISRNDPPEYLENEEQ